MEIIQSKFIKLLFIMAMTFMSPVMAGTLIVTNMLSNSVSFFDETTARLIKEIKVGYMPHEVIITPDEKIALVSNFGDLLNIIPGHSLTTIDLSNGKPLKTIKLPKHSRPHGLALLSSKEVLVTAQGIQSLLVVNFMTGAITKKIPLPGAGAHMVLTDTNKHYAYIANTDSGSVLKLNLLTFTVEANVKIGKQAEGLALSSTEDTLFVTDRKDHDVAVLNTQDLSLQKKIKTGRGPVRVALFDNGRSLLVINTVSGNVQIINTANFKIEKTWKTTLSHSPLPVPINIAVLEGQKKAYISNSFANDTTLIDLDTGEILKTFSSGYFPDGIAISQVLINDDHHANAYEVFKAEPIDIQANIEKVWQIVKKVEDYNRISNGAVTAHVDGEVAPGKTILLQLYKDSCIGKFIPKSTEIITVVDDDQKILSWIRQIKGSDYTERYQLLEKISDSKTRSSIVVRIPGLFGKITKHTIGHIINDALNALNHGMKVEAEG